MVHGCPQVNHKNSKTEMSGSMAFQSCFEAFESLRLAENVPLGSFEPGVGSIGRLVEPIGRQWQSQRTLRADASRAAAEGCAVGRPAKAAARV